MTTSLNKLKLIILIIGVIFFIAIAVTASRFLITNPQPQPTILGTAAVSISPLSLASIFADKHDWVATLSAEKVRTLIATGDIIPARSVNTKVRQLKNFRWPYEQTAEVLASGDITFINLETPLLTNCPSTVEGMIFCGDARNIEGLIYAGVDVASLGNNHAGNYGVAGVQETIRLLESQLILVTGVDGAAVKDVRGRRFAFLGYNDIGRFPGVAQAEEEKIRSDIAQAREIADVVVVTYHWGIEYTTQPSARQRQLGSFTIAAGADLVIGNHPHWIQPVEIYQGKLITYAHGNFVFDQMWSQKTREGVVGRYTFYDKTLVDIEYFPLQIDDYGQPHFLEGGRKKQILDEMSGESIKLARNPAM